MGTSFACVIYPTALLTERAISRGFAVALAGFDVQSPVVLVGEIRNLPGFSVAFYKSGLKIPSYEEFDHVCELFEEDLPPGIAIRDGASKDAVVHALVYSDDVIHDDAWRFSERAVLRHFVREGDDGLEAGEETLEEASVTPLDVDEDDDAELAQVTKTHRGTTFLSAELGVPILPALVGALFEAERRVPVRLVDPSAPSIAEETRRLNQVLRRVDGRGGRSWPSSVAGVGRPSVLAAFADVYDFADPTDASDLYRELSIGRIEGTLHFARPADLDVIAADERWAPAAAAGAFPLATVSPSALGGAKKTAVIVGISADGEHLVVTDSERGVAPAGPTFGELLAYLALGFKTRDDVEEDVIGALMLRAKLRASAAQ